MLSHKYTTSGTYSMNDSMASLKDAKDYLNELPLQLDEYLDDSYRSALHQLIEAFDQFFNVIASINIQARENKIINQNEATDIGDHGLVLLLKLVDLMERLDLPHKRQEIEQISLIFARWILRYGGKVNHLEPLVNAFAQLANIMQDNKSLKKLFELMSQVVDACSTEIKQDLDKSDEFRPWRLLHINRGIVATRTHDLEIMKTAFDEILVYLPQEATSFFDEGMREMDSLDYPQHVRELIAFYQLQKPAINLH
jgi:hypothetical protein